MVNIFWFSNGFFWSLAYLLVIFKANKDDTFGIPLIAILLNVSWELVYSFITPHYGEEQLYFNYFWLFLDLIILYQLFRYGAKELDVSRPKFQVGIVFLLFVCVLLALFLGNQFSTIDGDLPGLYTGYSFNVIMSVAFISMILRRKDLRGQSLYIGLCKFLGSNLFSIGLIVIHEEIRYTPYLYFCFVMVFLADLVYLALLLQYRGSPVV